MKRYKSYHQLVRTLKRDLPAKYPVSVRRVTVPRDEFGHCMLNRRKFIINIDRFLPEWLAIEVLLHEWAHCLSWSEKEYHSDQWGVAYSQTYRAFLNFKESIPKTKQAEKIFTFFNI